MTTSIVLDDVTKTFKLRFHRTIKQMSVAKMRGQETSTDFRAVDGVSFTVEQGESIGLMGLNGSGKSTLLKMISGVMKPDGGSVLTRGRIAGLIATGAGFHPQLTGRENLFLNAAILGMSEKETNRKFDEIVDFAGTRGPPRHPGRPLLLGPERPARLRDRGPRRLRHLPRRRGAGRR